MTTGARREIISPLILLVVLLIGGVLLARWLPKYQPPYHPQSKTANGTLALWRWLENMGYQVERLPASISSISQESDMIILFPGTEHVSDEDAAWLYDWVATGHTLVLVDMQTEYALNDQFRTTALGTTHFLEQEVEKFGTSTMVQALPLLPQAPASLRPAAKADVGIEMEDEDALFLVALMYHGLPVAVMQQVGEGEVWHLTMQAAPTNQALREDIGYLIPALLRDVPAGGVIIMDIYHPSTAPALSPAPQTPTLLHYLLTTSWGWAILLSLLLLLFFLILQGRHLGPPLPAPHQTQRREAAEYVKAMARLKRRAQQRPAVARHQSRRLRTGLTKTWPIDPHLPLPDFIAALQQSESPPSSELLQRIEQTLAGLESAPSEAQLVSLAAQVDDILAGLRYPQGRK